MIEKIPDYLVKYIIAGLIVFVAILIGFMIRDVFTYRFSLPHERYFYSKCEVLENKTIVYIITKEDLKFVKLYDLDGNLLHLKENLHKDSEYPIKINKEMDEPILIEYLADKEIRTAYVKCNKVKKEKGLISKILGI